MHHSPDWWALLGYADDELPADFLFYCRLVHPDDQERLKAGFDVALYGQQRNYALEFRLRHKLGHYLPVLLYGFIERNQDGVPLRVSGSFINLAEQKAAETWLKSAFEFTGQIIRSVQEGIVVYGLDRRYLLWNPFMERMTGISAVQCLGRRPEEVFPSMTETRPLDALEHALAGKTVSTVPYSYTIPETGKTGWAISVKSPLYDGAGRIIGAIAIVNDITALKNVQQQQVEMIFNSAPEAMLMVDGDGRLTFANNRAAMLFGYHADELLETSVDALVPESFRANHVAVREHYMRQPIPRAMSRNPNLSACRKDGSLFPVEISLNPILIDNREQVIVTVLDITERKRVERELQLAATVYKAVGEAIMVCDPDNLIIAVNHAFCQLTGYTHSEAVGRSTALLKSGRHGKRFYQNMWDMLHKTGHWQGKIWNRRKNGEIYLEWLVISTVYDEDGRVQQRVGMFSDITQQKYAAHGIWQQANFDPLTGLPNRNTFQDRLNQEIKNAKRNGLRVGLMFLDLDRFKEVNDSLGHDIGDELLKETAERIGRCVRETDTIARLGGDEFTLILGELETATVIKRAARNILQHLVKPFELGGETIYVSTSIGISIYPSDTEDAAALIQNAAQAMYAAKQLGRNRYCYFTPSMQQAAKMRLRLIKDLHEAVDTQRFHVHYQPIVDLGDHSIHKAEALLRWQHGKHGLMNPGEFIPLAEETGLIIPIGDWVFHEAAAQVARWRERLHPEFQISINKSPVQFRNDIHPCNEQWLKHLHAMGLPSSSIVVEITEGLLMEGAPADKLLAFRDTGIQVAIDDFGTGYSSLAYLKKFDIDYLKIDQSFIRNLAEEESDLALCEAIIMMAHKLGLKVIAEGIETREQLALLSAAGCDYGQGYLFSKPLPASEFEAQFEIWRTILP